MIRILHLENDKYQILFHLYIWSVPKLELEKLNKENLQINSNKPFFRFPWTNDLSEPRSTEKLYFCCKVFSSLCFVGDASRGFELFCVGDVLAPSITHSVSSKSSCKFDADLFFGSHSQGFHSRKTPWD